MTTRNTIIRHRFGGGWATDFGPTAEVDATEGGLVSVPWLNEAVNVDFLLDGGVRKAPGTQKLNAAELASGAAIRGLFDYWRLGTLGSPAQKRVLHVGTVLMKDDADGNFTNIATGLQLDAVPCYELFDDDLIIMSDAAADVPRVYDQSTVATLGTNTPLGAFGVTHKNRFWMAGVDSDPSGVYYSMAYPDGPQGDWNDASAGVIRVDPGDGDRVTGLVSHKNELWVFKGPHKGSIHRIAGSSPTGSDAFSRNVFVRGTGSVNHNSIFKFQDDVGFLWSDGSFRSLNATAAFGDFREASLSLAINTYLRDRVNYDALRFAWAKTLTSRGVVVITLPTDTSTNNNVMLFMDFRFIPVEGQPRWSRHEHVEAACLEVVIDATNNDRPTLFTGGNDGFVRRMGRSNRSVDETTSYEAKIELPYLHYGLPMQMKTLENAAIGVSPRGAYDITLGYTMDNHARQTATVAQGGGDVLAPAPANQFTLGTSQLGGARFTDLFFNLESAGEFRSIQFDASQAGLDEDMEVHTITAEISRGALSLEN